MKDIKYIIILIIIASFYPNITNAKSEKGSDSIYIGVFVCDAFTHNTMKDAFVSFLDRDSVLLTVSSKPYEIKGSRGIRYRYLARIARQDSIIIKAETRGYEPGYTTVIIEKNEDDKMADDILLHRKPIELDEVTVIGSKVLMVNRGDTIVYNASALQLSNGAMLDALIKQLPGVELHQGGRITVNGKYVSSLLVNGRNFFKGDPKIALDNLPAYYVDKVKVYHEVTPLRQVMYGDSVKADEQKDPLVMDVNLKRDYAEGWICNGDIGYGTENRYMVRLFGMRYTNHSNLFLFGNINNLNNTESTDKEGNWRGNNLKEGMTKTQTYGVNFSGDDKITKMKYSSSAKLSITNRDNETISSADNYYTTGDVFQRSKSQEQFRSVNFDWEGQFTYPKSGKFYFYILPNLSYTKNDNDGIRRTASFIGNPSDGYRGASIDSLYSLPGSTRLTSILINMNELLKQGSDDNIFGRSIISGNFPIRGKWVELRFMGSFGNVHRRYYEYEDIISGQQTSTSDNRQYHYTEQPSRNYDYSALLKYNLLNKDATELSVSYEYRQTYSSGERQLYRLDRYDQYTKGDVGILPSTTDSLQAAIDLRNSYYSTSFNRENKVTFNLHWRFFQLMFPIAWGNDRLTDNRNNLQKTVERNKPHVNLLLSYHKGKRGEGSFSASYRMDTRLPNMNYLLDVRDDADPLNISLGNSDLKSSIYHVLSFSYNKMKAEKQKNISINYNLDFVQDGISIGRSYDISTGVNTTKPENIKGNWSTWGNFSYGQQVDKLRHLSINTSTDYRYHHSVDYSFLAQDYQRGKKNIVHNLSLSETMKAVYRLKNCNVTAIGHVGWTHATSPTEGFTTINAVDYNYGVNFSKPFFNYLDIDTEMMMWSRRGYTDPMMNDDQLIWNLMLTYSFGKLKQWMLKAEGHDILHQISSVRQSLNAQGRTETWYKTIPSYWMLHLVYQFKKTPKKRNL